MKKLLILTLLFFFLFSCSDNNSSENDKTTDDSDISSTDDSDNYETDESQSLFDPTRIVEVEIEMAKEDWDFIRTQVRGETLSKEDCLAEPFYSPFEYRPATVSVNGKKVENAGVRKKGFLGSLDENKPSLKIKFDEYVEDQELFDLSRMTLNNNKSDDEFVSQCIAYQLFRKAGVVAPRCNFAHVTVNGENLGLFTHLDSIKKRFISYHFDDNEGRLFEGTMSDFREGWDSTFEIKTNKDNSDRSAIEAVKTALDLPDKDLEAALSKLIDMDQFYKFWALELLINHIDGYTRGTNNFYVYVNPDTGLMHFIPWGADSIFYHSSKYGNSLVYARAKLSRRLYMLPSTQAKFIAAAKDILENVWIEDDILGEIDRMETLIADIAENDPIHSQEKPNGDKPFGTGEVETTREFIKGRRAEVEEVLNTPPLWEEPLPDPPCLGEEDGKDDPQCEDGDTFEKNGIDYECVDGKWVEKS